MKKIIYLLTTILFTFFSHYSLIASEKKINTLVSQSMQQVFVLMVYKLLKLKVMKNLYYFLYIKDF